MNELSFKNESKFRIHSKTLEYKLYDAIEEFEAYEDLIDELENLSEEDTLILKLNSPGGRIDVGFMIIDAMQQSKGKVICQVVHDACSMAGMIALAGDGLILNKHTYVMLHDYSCLRYGKGHDLKLSSKATDKMFSGRFKEICIPFLTDREAESILKGEDFYIHDDDQSLEKRIKKHFM